MANSERRDRDESGSVGASPARTVFAFLLVSIVCAGSCARASVLPVADGVPSQRIITLGPGIMMRSGPQLRGLPPDQRYRFVAPESLASGVSADVLASWESKLALLRQAFSTAIGSGRWVESTDSVQFDVTIFTTERTTLRPERHAPPPVMPGTECGAPSAQLQQCTEFPSASTRQWDTAYDTYHVLRRRSDGAIRVWRRPGIPELSGSSTVAADLHDMLRAGERQPAPTRVP
jgi:hypothetical protein